VSSRRSVDGSRGTAGPVVRGLPVSACVQSVERLVHAAADRVPEAIAIADPGNERSLTYRHLCERIEVVASGLHAIGVRPGARVATVAGNTLDHIVAIFALQRLGAVAALVNHRLAPETVAQLLDRGRVSHALVEPDDALAAGVVDVLGEAGRVVTLGAGVDGLTTLDAVAAQARGDAPRSEPQAEDPAFVFYSSGTTGLPKGIVVSHRATLPRIAWLTAQGGLRHGPGNRCLGVLPVNHVMGFYGALLATLALDGTYVVLERWSAAAALELIEHEQVTTMTASPTQLYDLLGAPELSEAGVSSLRTVAHTGGPISVSLLERTVEALPATLWQLYGTTEMMNSLYAGPQTARPQVLRPGLFSRVRVAPFGGDPEAPVAPGEEGELLVGADSPAAFSGYLGQPELTREKLVGGWYRTGDAARVTADGAYELKGRTDDMIVCGAENVHPEEVEDFLGHHPAVGAVALVGAPDERWGEVPVAYVEPTGEAALSAAELDAFCRDGSLANYKRPRHYFLRDLLPRNPMGKVLRRVLREDVAHDLELAGGLEFAPSVGRSGGRPHNQDRQETS
jgi:2-furoate---CoA ligase